MNVSTGGTPYAVGYSHRGRFRLRCVRFGKLSASYEMRSHEEIRRVSLKVADVSSKPERVSP